MARLQLSPVVITSQNRRHAGGITSASRSGARVRRGGAENGLKKKRTAIETWAVAFPVS